jgi:hypothetical protein
MTSRHTAAGNSCHSCPAIAPLDTELRSSIVRSVVTTFFEDAIAVSGCRVSTTTARGPSGIVRRVRCVLVDWNGERITQRLRWLGEIHEIFGRATLSPCYLDVRSVRESDRPGIATAGELVIAFALGSWFLVSRPTPVTVVQAQRDLRPYAETWRGTSDDRQPLSFLP